MPEPNVNEGLRRRALFLMFATALLALLFNAQWFRVYWARPDQYIDIAVKLEQRLAPLRDALPRSGHVVYRGSYDSRALHLHSLAPLVVTGDLGLGDVRAPALAEYLVVDQESAEPPGPQPGYTLLKDCGNGVRFYRRDNHPENSTGNAGAKP